MSSSTQLPRTTEERRLAVADALRALRVEELESRLAALTFRLDALEAQVARLTTPPVRRGRARLDAMPQVPAPDAALAAVLGDFARTT